MSLNSNRRDFIKQTAALGTGWWVGAHTNAFADSKNPLERLNFACIGVGGKGDSDSNDAGRNGNIVALCDIDDTHLGKKLKRFDKAQKFNDYREMFDKMAGESGGWAARPAHRHP